MERSLGTARSTISSVDQGDGTTTEDPLTDRRKRGREIQQKLLGLDSIRAARSAAEELAPDFVEMLDEANWGSVWGREGLELKQRSLCVITCLLVQERYPYAATHIRGARRIGITRDELVEVILQLTFYAGIPVAHNGLAIVREVYDNSPGS